MDDKWFKNQQKLVGVTADDIARRAGRDRSVVSHIYTGRQKMSLDWAKAFAEVLQVPIATVLEKAGVAEPAVARELQPGFADSDVAPWHGGEAESREVTQIALALGRGDGVEVWQVRRGSLALMGYLPGDFLLVDTYASERTRAGDAVVARIHDNSSSRAVTALRRHEPPVLVAASSDLADRRVHVVDGTNVVIAGKIIGSWRK